MSIGRTTISRRITSRQGFACGVAQAVAVAIALAGACLAAGLAWCAPSAPTSTPKRQSQSQFTAVMLSGAEHPDSGAAKEILRFAQDDRRFAQDDRLQHAGSGTGSKTAAAREIVLQIQWYPQAQFAGYMVAQDKGFFEKAGLPGAKLLWSKAGDRPFDRLVDGKADFCTGWLSEGIVERARGAPLVHVAQVFQHSSMMLVARSNSGIATPADMTGRRVGLWGGNFDVPVLAFFAKHQVRPTIVPQSASMVPFLRSAVDVASAMRYNEYHRLIEAGVRPEELRVFEFADYGMAFPEDGLYCSQRTRRERPEMCAALVAACREGWDYALDHEAETLEVVMTHCQQANVRTNRNHQQWMLRSVAAAIRGRPGDRPAPWGSLARDVYQGVAKALVDQRLIDQTPAFEAFHQPPERP